MGTVIVEVYINLFGLFALHCVEPPEHMQAFGPNYQDKSVVLQKSQVYDSRNRFSGMTRCMFERVEGQNDELTIVARVFLQQPTSWVNV